MMQPEHIAILSVVSLTLLLVIGVLVIQFLNSSHTRSIDKQLTILSQDLNAASIKLQLDQRNLKQALCTIIGNTPSGTPPSADDIAREINGFCGMTPSN